MNNDNVFHYYVTKLQELTKDLEILAESGDVRYVVIHAHLAYCLDYAKRTELVDKDRRLTDQ